MAKRGTSKPKKMVGATNCFKLAAFRLLAHKAFVDFKLTQSVFPCTEPEHFVEDWIKKNLNITLHKAEEHSFWNEFMYLLIEKAKS